MVITDEELVIKAQKGDSEAELEIFSRYKNLLRKVCRSYFLIGGDIEDLIQEGMIGLYKAIKSFTPEKKVSFASFASLCINRQVQTAVKKASSQKNLILSTALPLTGAHDSDEDDDGSLEIIIPSNEPTPEERMISKETVKEMKDEIKKKLSDMEQKVLSSYLKGQPYKSISLETGLSAKSIDNALSRIKKKLEFLKTLNQ